MAIVFVAAQLVSAFHGAEFGSDIHSHDGELCSISLFCDRDDDLDLPDALQADRFHRFGSILVPTEWTSPNSNAVPLGRAREPPRALTA